MKDNNPLLNSDIDCEFLILIYQENQSFKVEWKERVLKTISTTLKGGHTVVSSFDGWITF